MTNNISRSNELFMKYLQLSFIIFTLINIYAMFYLTKIGLKMFLSLIKEGVKQIILSIRDSWMWVKETFSTKNVEG